jgi:hypothetical protein
MSHIDKSFNGSFEVAALRVRRVRFTVQRITATLALAIASPLLLGCGNLEGYPDAASVFEATFHAPPGPGVSILQANGTAFRDSSHAYLRLKATPTSFDSLTSNGFERITKAEYESRAGGGAIFGPSPSWWAPLDDGPTLFLYSANFHPNLSRGRAIVAYNPDSQITNIYWDEVD